MICVGKAKKRKSIRTWMQREGTVGVSSREGCAEVASELPEQRHRVPIKPDGNSRYRVTSVALLREIQVVTRTVGSP